MRRFNSSSPQNTSREGLEGQLYPREWRQVTAGLKSRTGTRLAVIVLVLLSGFFVISRMKDQVLEPLPKSVRSLQSPSSQSNDWTSSCAPRSSNWDPPNNSSGYLLVRCNGGLNQQRTAICNAVLAARILNATLVLPQLDSTLLWHDESGFSSIYDVEHFIESLKKEIDVVRALPVARTVGSKRLKIKPYQLNPPRDASVSWYETTAMEAMKKHGALYLSPFSHPLNENLENYEYQRLRCRVNYHALRFNNATKTVASMLVQRLRTGGPYVAIHLRFEKDMLASSGCLDIFSPEEQESLKKYRTGSSSELKIEHTHRRLIGKCPLTPKEVGLFLQTLGFDSSSRIYLAGGEVFGGEKFLKSLRDMFPRLETRATLARPDELALVTSDGHGVHGPAVDYMICLLADVFVPTYDGPSNLANNLIGERLYYGFRPTLQPDRKALAPLFLRLENGKLKRSDFEVLVREAMRPVYPGTLHTRAAQESFYTNPWPECFCQIEASQSSNMCPSHKQDFETHQLANSTSLPL